ncbi:MAG: DUF6036 family nucleotidyltransferase [Betaproteobacteria bacterium]
MDARILEVRALSPLDLAVSKLSRFNDTDRGDIEVLARENLIDAASLRRRAEEALQNYVGNTAEIRTSIELACNLITNAQQRNRT